MQIFIDLFRTKATFFLHPNINKAINDDIITTDIQLYKVIN